MDKSGLVNRGLRVISLELDDNPLFPTSKLFYNFIDEGDNSEAIYTTIIIGPNGTGKSNLFRIVIELFKELNDLKTGKGKSSSIGGRYAMIFRIDEDIFEYSNNESRLIILGKLGNPVKLKKNGVSVPFTEVKLPESIIASSVMLTDKYPFYKKETNKKTGEKISAYPQYKYLGVRNIAQNASTRAYVRRTVEFIVQDMNSTFLRKGLQLAMNFLELTNSIGICYYPENVNKFFKGKLTVDTLIEYFDKIREKYPTSEHNPPYKLNHFLKIRKNSSLLTSVCNFCNSQVFEKPQFKHYEFVTPKPKIIYDLIDDESFAKLIADFEILEHLRQLGIVSAPEIELKRLGNYSLQESSSGEYHFFSSIVGLLATIKHDSLVFIDEPEISLHPNWQMKYLGFVRELFSGPEFASSHMFIATHSHFLISDLIPDSSKIVGLKKQNGITEIVELPRNLNTFGWSAEQILLEVFQVPTTRNYFIAEKVGEILELISETDRDLSQIRLLVKNLISLNIVKLSSEDPLKSIIDKLIEKYG
jgi:AAA15 family ATPase/GTPase